MQWVKTYIMYNNNNLPEYWAVKNDNSQLFKDTVIKYLNTTYNQDWDGTAQDAWYGYNSNYKNCNGTFNTYDLFDCINKPTIFTLKEFIDLTGVNLKQGDLVEVSDNKKDWEEKIFITNLGSKFDYPIVVVAHYSMEDYYNGRKARHIKYKYMRPIQEPKPVLIEMSIDEIASKLGIKTSQLRIKD